MIHKIYSKIYSIKKINKEFLNLVNYFLVYNFIFIFFVSLAYTQENKILFKVNNNIITTIDILNEINYLKSVNLEFNNAEKNIEYEIAKNSIIREKIKEIEILKFVDEIQISEKLLNNLIINNFKYLNINSKEEFDNYFINKKIDPLFIKKKLSIEVLWNQIIYSKFNDKIKIDVKEIRNKLLNTKQKEFFLSEILFELNDGEELNKKFKLIKNTIDDKNFNQAALQFSISDSSKNGGKIGWLKDTAINIKILENLKGLDKGNYSEPIVVPGGFLILKIEDIREIEKNVDLENETQKVIENETNQQLNQFSNIYFNKIKKNILINEL